MIVTNGRGASTSQVHAVHQRLLFFVKVLFSSRMTSVECERVVPDIEDKKHPSSRVSLRQVSTVAWCVDTSAGCRL